MGDAEQELLSVVIGLVTPWLCSVSSEYIQPGSPATHKARPSLAAKGAVF